MDVATRPLELIYSPQPKRKKKGQRISLDDTIHDALSRGKLFENCVNKRRDLFAQNYGKIHNRVSVHQTATEYIDNDTDDEYNEDTSEDCSDEDLV